MRIEVHRYDLNEKRTIGKMSINGLYFSYTLEDCVREGEKIPGKTAIPYGKYAVTITLSERFKRPMPLIKDVPNFTGVRIHPGNTAADTEGCILVGRVRGEDDVLESQTAFRELFERIRQAQEDYDPITIEILRQEGQ